MELIQVRNDVPSMYRDFRDGHLGRSMSPTGPRTSTPTWRARRRKGMRCMSGEVGERGRFVYFAPSDHPGVHPGTVIELSEVAGPKGTLFRMIREASEGWDGNDQVRPLPTCRSSEPKRHGQHAAGALPDRDAARSGAGRRGAGRQQSSGTFVRVAGETTSCARAAAPSSSASRSSNPRACPACPAPGWSARAIGGPWRRARITVAFRSPTWAPTCRRSSPPPWPAISRPQRDQRRAPRAPRAAGRRRALRAPAPRH